MHITFFSMTNIPQVVGRRAEHYYSKLVWPLRALGVDSSVVCPKGSPFIKDIPDGSALYFDCHDHFLRWLGWKKTDLLVVWSSKPYDRATAEHARLNCGIPVIYAELGWMPQRGTMHLDEVGTGPHSSLCHYKPPPCPEGFTIAPSATQAPDKHLGLLLQCEADFQFQSGGGFPNNGTFVQWAMFQRAFKGCKLMVRPHPLQQDVQIPEHERIEVVRDGSLHDFCCRVSVVAGMNSTALVECLSYGKQCYQFGIGIGHGSGAFLKTPVNPTAALEENPDFHDRRRASRNLIYDLKQRQINVETVKPGDLLGHPVLGKHVRQPVTV